MHPVDQVTQTIGLAADPMTTRTLQQPLPGGGQVSFSAPMDCLTPQMAAIIANCYANPGSPDCAAVIANAGLPLCTGPGLPLPDCRDDGLQAALNYCDKYGPNGPDPVANATCWLASKDPAWYGALKTIKPCPGSEQEKGKKMLMWGGILLAAVVVGGGAYYYYSKKKG